MNELRKKRLGLRIRELRDKKGISQEFMANLLEMDRKTYGRQEKRGLDMNLDHLEKISEALGLEGIYELLPDDGHFFFHKCDHQHVLGSNNTYYEPNEKLVGQMHERISAQQKEIEFLREQLATSLNNRS